MNYSFCDRTANCLNFRHAPKTYCSICGTQINMNHFHSNSDSYRLCFSCFRDNLEQIEKHAIVLIANTKNERPDCLKQPECFRSQPYGLFIPKVCDGCGEYPISHFHDIKLNIRLCLHCFLKRQRSYIDAGELNGKRQAAAPRGED